MCRGIFMKGSMSLAGLIFVLILLPASPATSQEMSAEQLRLLGRSAFEAGQFGNAERLFRAALREFEANAAAPEPDKIAETLGDLASVLLSQELHAEAEQLLVRALGIMNSGSVLNQRHTPILLGNLGTLYELTGRHELAERTFTQALRSAQKHLGAGDPYSATLLGNIGVLHSRAGKDKAAEKEFRKALAVAEGAFGTNSSVLAPILTNLAAVYGRQKKWATAEPLLLRSLALLENSLGPDHPDLSVVLEHLGVVHFRQDKMKQAEIELRRALEIELRTGRAKSMRIASISLDLARVLAAEGNATEARILYSNTLTRQEQTFGPNALEVAATLEQYAKLLHSVKSETMAREMEVRAKRIRAERAFTVRVNR